MTKKLSFAAFLLGAAAIIWMGAGFIGSNGLALCVTAMIAAAYTVGFAELLRFQQATATLSCALTTPQSPIESLDSWLITLPVCLQNACRLRIEGERAALPGPTLTPYLVGLLVMLGLLGTFIGMVDTLKGAVIALEASTELDAVRAGLAAPIKGLGLAFGTSVAGITASALLGLISTLSRKERILASRLLDNKIPTLFQHFSISYSRLQAYKVLHDLPEQLDDLGEKISSRLLDNQEKFHTSVSLAYTDLAQSVAESLKTSLGESGRLAGESMTPVIASAMTKLSDDHEKNIQQWLSQQSQSDELRLQQWTQSLQENQQQTDAALNDNAKTFNQELQQLGQSQLSAIEQVTTGFDALSSTLTNQWQNNTEQQQQQQQAIHQSLEKAATQISDDTHSHSELMQTQMQTRLDNESSWLKNHDARMHDLTTSIETQLNQLHDAEELRGQAAVNRLSELETTVASQLAQLGNALEAPMTRLIDTASQAPKAAAEVIEQLRGEISKNIERDNSLLEERQRIMADLNTVSTSLKQASDGQREAAEMLVTSSTDMLKNVGNQFSELVSSEASKLSETADHFSTSASEMACMGESFTQAMQLFTTSNSQLMENLNRIEEAMDKSSIRSDEQLNYYIAQARELIDHSMLSQKEIFEELRQISQQPSLLSDAV